MKLSLGSSSLHLGVLVVLPGALIAGCAFKVDMPLQNFEDGGTRGDDGGIELLVPDAGEDLSTPDAVGPACENDMDCEGAMPARESMPQCRQWGCDKKAGQCDWIPIADGTTCFGDADPCVLSWKCMGGECKKHNLADCDDKNPCTTDWCAPGLGCNYGNADGTPCNDGKQCTTDDMCQEGACLGNENCPTETPCEVGMCNDQGFCEYYATPGRPECGGCYGWGLPGPQGEMIECCQDGQWLVPRMYCGDSEVPCGDPEGPLCQEMCQKPCGTNQQVCVPCGNGYCDGFESPCNCPEDCGQTQPGCQNDSQCPQGQSCVGGMCQPGSCTSIEICNDDQDNDCDGSVDEPDCIGQGCVTPAGYFITSIAELVAVNSSAKPGSKVAFKGLTEIVTKFNPSPCEGPCCPSTKYLFKATDGGVKFVILKGIGCKSDTCDPEVMCEPPEGMYYQFWGTYQKEQVDGVDPTVLPVLYVEGWCMS